MGLKTLFLFSLQRKKKTCAKRKKKALAKKQRREEKRREEKRREEGQTQRKEKAPIFIFYECKRSEANLKEGGGECVFGKGKSI